MVLAEDEIDLQYMIVIYRRVSKRCSTCVLLRGIMPHFSNHAFTLLRSFSATYSTNVLRSGWNLSLGKAASCLPGSFFHCSRILRIKPFVEGKMLNLSKMFGGKKIIKILFSLHDLCWKVGAEIIFKQYFLIWQVFQKRICCSFYPVFERKRVEPSKFRPILLCNFRPTFSPRVLHMFGLIRNIKG